MRKRFALSWSIITVLAAATVQAQEADLDPVTVTASYNPARVSKTGRNLFVIKGERVAGLPVHSLDELLRYLPGIEMQARGPFGSQSDITLRGGTFQQVLVMVDGARVNDPNTGHFSTYIPLAPGEIERIEILKGAASALYGSDAVGGVVNIITKTFSAPKEGKKKNGLMRLTAGEYRTLMADAGYFKNNGKTAFGVGGQLINTRGQLQRGTRGFVESGNASVSVSHHVNEKWQLSLRSTFDSRKFSAQNFYTFSPADTAQETIRTVWNQLQLTRRALTHNWRFQLGYKHLSDSFAFNSRTPSNQNKTSLWQAMVLHERKLGEKTSISPGLQFINKRIASNDRGHHTVSQGAAFLIVNQQLGENVFVSPSARIEWNERAGWEAIPQINLSYRTRALQLRGSAGKTIRDADFTERFNNYSKTLVAAGQRLGNPDLAAERSFSYEGGADYFLGQNLKVSGTYFQRLHKKLIDYVLTPASAIPRNQNLVPGGNYLFAENIAEVNTSGFETDVQFQQQGKKQKSLWATLGLIWLRSKSDNATPSLYVSSHARFQANLSMQYTFRQVTVSANGLYKKRSVQKASSALIAPVSPDYFLLNAKAEVYVWQKKWSVFAEVNNVGDRAYTDLLGAQMPGRWLMAGTRINLGE